MNLRRNYESINLLFFFLIIKTVFIKIEFEGEKNS
jgi:hypothetical protein